MGADDYIRQGDGKEWRKRLISLVMPTLNAASSIERALSSVAAGVGEMIVVDGGSIDQTAEIAARSGARVLASEKGRGRQLAAGAQAAEGDWLLFLHADTVLQPRWAEAAARFIRDLDTDRKAAFFRLRFDDDSKGARRVARIANWRASVCGLPYGDQGLLIRRAHYEALGGYEPMPLMEDVALVRRIGRRRLQMLEADAVTSAERYRREGWLRRPARNLTCLALYFLGVSPQRIARLYA